MDIHRLRQIALDLSFDDLLRILRQDYGLPEPRRAGNSVCWLERNAIIGMKEIIPNSKTRLEFVQQGNVFPHVEAVDQWNRIGRSLQADGLILSFDEVPRDEGNWDRKSHNWPTKKGKSTLKRISSPNG
jgi:hypothetical protein